MRKLSVSCLFLLVLGVSCNSVKAQEKILHGVVTVFDSIPLVNVHVKIKSTKQVIYTDSIGKFSAVCNSKDQLKFEAEGFYAEKLDITKQAKYAAVNLRLKEGKKAREHAIGYTTVSDRDKLNSIVSLNSDEMEFGRYANMYDLIRGKLAGVQIINEQVVIRGIKANSNSAALIVVDGIARNGSVLRSLSPMQVKSINVIKDGSSAIYGMKGANGVVVIETKKGGDSTK